MFAEYLNVYWYRFHWSDVKSMCFIELFWIAYIIFVFTFVLIIWSILVKPTNVAGLFFIESYLILHIHIQLIINLILNLTTVYDSQTLIFFSSNKFHTTKIRFISFFKKPPSPLKAYHIFFAEYSRLVDSW